MEPDDLDLLYEIENEQVQWSVGTATMPYSRDLLRQYILSTTGDIFTDKQVRLIIEHGGKAIGLVDLTSFDPKNLRAEVGIIILPKFRCQGLATQAIRILEEYALNTVHIHQLYAIVPENNIASFRLFQNYGFTCICNLNDWIFDGNQFHNAHFFQKLLVSGKKEVPLQEK